MIGTVMSRSEVADFFRRAGTREDCASAIARGVLPDVLDTLDDEGLLEISAQLLLDHIRHCKFHRCEHCDDPVGAGP